jgi:hypothetical protein
MAGLAGPPAVAEQFIVVNFEGGSSSEKARFEEVRDAVKPPEGGRVRLGVAAIFSYLNGPRDRTLAAVRRFLQASEETGIPVVVQIDGEQWWDGRPDLWNWWDPAAPGYDPENRRNVEWTGWSPDQAVKIAWRNWGRQIRVRPPPNLMSPRYREACRHEMRALLPEILAWWRALPEYRKHLLIGIKVGWESSIGVNTYHYPDGNGLLGRPESEDPKTGLKTDRMPDRGVAALGYAAVSTAGIATQGELQEAHQAEVARRHLEDLGSVVAAAGVPRDRLFTHTAGWKKDELLYDSAVNRHTCPGWSFYQHAADPAQDTGFRRALKKSDAPWWGAVEWLYMGKQDIPSWEQALDRTLAVPTCRYLCIYNWGGIKGNAAALTAIGNVLRKSVPAPR